MNNVNINTIKSTLFYIIIWVLFYLLNLYSPFINDDTIYAFIKGENTQVMSLTDAIRSQIYDYFHTNGRFIIHVIVQYFCGVLGFSLFKIINSFVFTLLCFNVYLLLKNEFKYYVNNNAILLFIILLMVFGVCRIYLDNIACSVNYLWTSFFILLFLLLWEKELKAATRKTSYYIVIFFISGIIGSLQESFSFGVAGALFIYYILKHRELNKGNTILIIGFLIGTSVNIFAPSNFIRLEETGGMPNSLHTIISRVFSVFYNSDSFLVLLIILSLFYINDKKGCIRFIETNLILLLSIIFNIAFTLFVAYTAPHQLTCIELFSILLIIKLIYTRYSDFLINRRKVFLVLYLIILSLLYIPVFYCRRDIGTGHNRLIDNAYKSNDGCVIANEYYNSVLTKDNWFYNNFTRQEVYNNFCKVGLSAIVTHGENWNFIKSILPDEKSNLMDICKDENMISKYIYKEANKPYFIVKIPLREDIENLCIEVAYEPALRDWLKNLLSHTELIYTIIKKNDTDSFEHKDIRYYIIYDSCKHKIKDIRLTPK